MRHKIVHLFRETSRKALTYPAYHQDAKTQTGQAIQPEHLLKNQPFPPTLPH